MFELVPMTRKTQNIGYNVISTFENLYIHYVMKIISDKLLPQQILRSHSEKGEEETLLPCHSYTVNISLINIGPREGSVSVHGLFDVAEKKEEERLIFHVFYLFLIFI